MTNRMAGKVAIVTGGAHGIGGAIADRLAADGAQVLVADVDGQAALARVEAIRQAGGTAEPTTVDVRKRPETEAMVQTAVGHWGRLDILVANAGIVEAPVFEDQP